MNDSASFIGSSSIYGNPTDAISTIISNKNTNTIPYLKANQIDVDKSTYIKNSFSSNNIVNILNCVDKLETLNETILSLKQLSIDAASIHSLIHSTSNIQEQIDYLNNTLIQNNVIIPTGMVIASASNKIPIGYLHCNGQLISKTTFSKLYSVIGVTYTVTIPGYSDGGKFSSSTTDSIQRFPNTYAPTGDYFAIPDFRGLMNNAAVTNTKKQYFFSDYSNQNSYKTRPVAAIPCYPVDQVIKYHSHNLGQYAENQNAKIVYKNQPIITGDVPLAIQEINPPDATTSSIIIPSQESVNFISSEKDSVPHVVYINYFIKY